MNAFIKPLIVCIVWIAMVAIVDVKHMFILYSMFAIILLYSLWVKAYMEYKARRVAARIIRKL